MEDQSNWKLTVGEVAAELDKLSDETILELSNFENTEKFIQYLKYNYEFDSTKKVKIDFDKDLFADAYQMGNPDYTNFNLAGLLKKNTRRSAQYSKIQLTDANIILELDSNFIPYTDINKTILEYLLNYEIEETNLKSNIKKNCQRVINKNMALYLGSEYSKNYPVSYLNNYPDSISKIEKTRKIKELNDILLEKKNTLIFDINYSTLSEFDYPDGSYRFLNSQFAKNTYLWGGKDWNQIDIGNTNNTGEINIVDDNYIIDASGYDIWGYSDAFNYFYAPLDGSSEISVKINKMNSVHHFSKAGIMIREGLTPSSKYVMLFLEGNNSICVHHRNTDEGKTLRKVLVDNISTPVYLKLARNNNNFYCYFFSKNGKWELFHTLSLSMSVESYTGLVVCSRERNLKQRVYFSNLSLNQLSKNTDY